MEENVRICTHCGRELDEYEGTCVGDELLCEDCVTDLCVVCDRCGETI